MRIVHIARQAWLGVSSRSSGEYWERRYRAGMTSGAGSYGREAAFKARFLNNHVRQHDIGSVIELGCGDGHQLSLAEYPRYLGIDVSKRAIEMTARRFSGDASKSFLWYDPIRSINLASFLRADLTLSLDVIYHLLEDETYLRHLDDLFSMSERFVIIYSSDHEGSSSAFHVRHRRFTDDVRRQFPQFRLTQKVENPYREQSFADFFLYERV